MKDDESTLETFKPNPKDPNKDLIHTIYINTIE